MCYKGRAFGVARGALRMEERTAQRYWQQAEGWVNEAAMALYRRGEGPGLSLCRRCGILPAANAFGGFYRGLPMIVPLCAECGHELWYGREERE